jgi:hypothetical protein
MTNRFYATGWRGRHWNALKYPKRVFATGLTGGQRPINTAYLPTVDSVVKNIDSQLQHLCYICVFLNGLVHVRSRRPAISETFAFS